MAIFKINKNKNYTIMSNYHLQDKELSLKSKGLLSVMLSLPNDWNYSINGLMSICNEKENTINSALNELKKNGYIKVDKLMPNQTTSGRIEYIYNVYEFPQDLEKQEGKKQDLEKQGLEKQGLVFEGVESNNIYNNIYNNNYNKILNNKILNNNNTKEEITKKDNIKYQDILDLYHQICTSLSKVFKLTDSRKKSINARLNEKDITIDTFKEVFTKAQNSSFLTGNNDRGFKADFDWLLNQSNFYKTLEGKYDNKISNNQNQSSSNNKSKKVYDYSDPSNWECDF